jgi:hypothetical protein
VSALTLDRNRTIWQRIQDRCDPTFGRGVADEIATLLLPYVNAERLDALERAGSLMPLHVLGEVSIVDFDNRGCTNVASLNCCCRSVGRSELQGSVGRAHGSPSVGAVSDTAKASVGAAVGSGSPSTEPAAPSGSILIKDIEAFIARTYGPKP